MEQWNGARIDPTSKTDGAELTVFGDFRTCTESRTYLLKHKHVEELHQQLTKYLSDKDDEFKLAQQEHLEMKGGEVSDDKNKRKDSKANNSEKSTG